MATPEWEFVSHLSAGGTHCSMYRDPQTGIRMERGARSEHYYHPDDPETWQAFGLAVASARRQGLTGEEAHDGDA